MKATRILLALWVFIATSIIIGCIDDKLPSMSTTDTALDEEGVKYIALKMSLAGGASSRATSVDNTDAYSDDEGSEALVDPYSSILLFFDDNDNYVTYAYLDYYTYGAGNTGIDTTLVFTVLPAPDSTGSATQMLVVLNCDDRSSLIGKSYSEVKAYQVETLPSSSDDYFLMSNAVRYVDDNFVHLVGDVQDYILDEVNTDSALEVYVEREAVKVTLQTAAGMARTDTSIYADIGTVPYYEYDTTSGSLVFRTCSARVVVNGIALNVYDTLGYVTRNCPTTFGTSTTYPWYDATTLNVLWAQDSAYTYSTSDSLHDDYASGQLTGATGVFKNAKYLSWSEVTDTMARTEYYHENTVDADAQYPNLGDTLCTPALLVAGTVYIDGNGDGTYDSYNDSVLLFKYNGIYYSDSAMMHAIVDGLSGWTLKAASSEDDLSSADSVGLSLTYISRLSFDVVAVDNTSHVILVGVEFGVTTNTTGSQIKTRANGGGTRVGSRSQSVDITSASNYQLYLNGDSSSLAALIDTINRTKYINVETTTKQLEDATGAVLYTNYTWAYDNAKEYYNTELNGASSSELAAFFEGKCYYQAPILHFDKSNNSAIGDIYGMVRNHYYTITLKSISSIGGPIFRENEDLFTIPAADIGVTCTVTTLDWAEVDNTVSF